MTSAEVIALTVFNGCIATIGTLSNILVKLAVLLTRQLREICTAVLPISLSMTDVIICAVHQPMNIYDINYGSSAIQRPFDLDWDLVFSWRPWTASSLPPWTASSTSRIPYPVSVPRLDEHEICDCISILCPVVHRNIAHLVKLHKRAVVHRRGLHRGFPCLNSGSSHLHVLYCQPTKQTN